MVIEVNKYSLNPRWFIAGTKGSYDVEPLEFVFSKEWEGLSKKVTFIPFGGEEISMYYVTPITIPYEVMVRPGTCVFALSGYSDAGKILTVTGELKVIDTIASPDNSEYVPTPDEMTQVLNMANRAIERAEEAKEIAEGAKSQAEEVLASANNSLAEVRGLAEGVEEKYDGMCEQYEASHNEYLELLEVKEEVEDSREEIENARGEVEESLALSKSYAAQAEEAAESLEKANDDYIHTFSNALIGRAEGRAVRADDALPAQQRLNVTLKGYSRQDLTGEIITQKGSKLSLYSKNMIPYPYKAGSKKINGVTFTPCEDGGLILNGTIGAAFNENYMFYQSDDTPAFVMKKGVTYRISCINGDNLSVRLCGTDYKTVVSTARNVQTRSFTPEVDTPIYKVLGYFYSADEGLIFENKKIYPIFDISAESVVYEPYAAKSVSVDAELFGVEDCTDELVVDADAGRVTLKKRYGSYIFTGNEEWNITSRNDGTTFAFIPLDEPVCEGMSDTKYQLCTRMPTKDVLVNESEQGVFASNEEADEGRARLYVRLADPSATAADFNSTFTSGDMLIYPTKESETDVSDTEYGKALLDTRLYAGCFTLDFDGGVSVRYVKDINKEFEKIYSAVVSLGAAL